MKWIPVLAVSYLIGSVSPSFFLGRWILRRDLTVEGTGNLGAKNSLHVGGAYFGVLVFLLDFLKGAGTVLGIDAVYRDPVLLYWAMVGVVAGHNYSLYLGFRGGKGLAALAGMLAVASPAVLLILVALVGLWVFLSRHAGVAAILAAVPYTLIFGFVTGDWRSWPFSLLLTWIVLSKHRPDEYAALAAFLRLKRM